MIRGKAEALKAEIRNESGAQTLRSVVLLSRGGSRKGCMQRLLSCMQRLLNSAAFRGMCLLARIGGLFRRRKIFVYYLYPDFERKAAAIADLLRRRGFNTELSTGLKLKTRVQLRGSPDLWVGFWNQVPMALLPHYYIFLNAEPIDVKLWSENEDWFRAMGNAQRVWSYTRSTVEYARQRGVSAQFVPFGYAPYYEAIFQKNVECKQLSQDIDVLFFGAMSERRRRMLDELQRRGMNVHVADRDHPAHGEKLDELLARAKIVLHIHFHEDPKAHYADLARLDHVLSNQLFVIHEKPSALLADPVFEKYITTCDYDGIPDTCAYFLAEPAARTAKAASAREWFKSEYALNAFIPYDDVRQLLGQGR